jgi:hypothetical protein
MLPWWVWPRFDRTLWSIALRALKEELYFFATAALAICTGITSHLVSSFLKLYEVLVDGNRYVPLELHQRWLQLLNRLLEVNELQFRDQSLGPLRKHLLFSNHVLGLYEQQLLQQVEQRTELIYVIL